jgi:hypothetical protein
MTDGDRVGQGRLALHEPADAPARAPELVERLRRELVGCHRCGGLTALVPTETIAARSATEEGMVRRLVLVALMVLLGAPAAAQAQALRGTFAVHFPKGHPASNAPCPQDVFCGVGRLVAYGAATITIVDEAFEEIPGTSCFTVMRVEQIGLIDGSGSLVIESSGTFCRPGGSGDSNAGPSSYGAPGVFRATFTVVGSASTGVFAGATGSGVEVMQVAGGIGVWRLTGSVDGATG